MKDLWLLLGLAFASLHSDAQVVCPRGQAIQALEAEYSQVRQMAEMYQRSGMGKEYQAELRKLQIIVNKFPAAYLDQEIRSFPMTRDPRCLLAVYSRIVDRQVQGQERSDRRWNILVDGAMAREGLTDDELLAMVNRAR